MTMMERVFTCVALLTLSVGLTSLAERAETRGGLRARVHAAARSTDEERGLGSDQRRSRRAHARSRRVVKSAVPGLRFRRGCDGGFPIAAGKRFGATAAASETTRTREARACLVEAEGVQDRVTVVQGDIFETDFNDATVVTLYLLPD